MRNPYMTSPNSAVPIIEAVPKGQHRPLWSVMIPTYNCAGYLRETLASVLAQDPGPEIMQVEVVDDCSDRDDPYAVVKEIAPGGRVTFHRHPTNRGVNFNLNACLQRSRGLLVHVLHGDDLVLPGFYQEMEALARRYPQAALYASRSLVIDSAGYPIGLTADFSKDGPVGLLPEFLLNLPFRTPSIVVRRSLYEKCGGFNPEYPHSADIDMWLRAIQQGGGCLTRHVLAAYRIHGASDTSRLAETAANLRDILRVYHNFASEIQGLDHRHFRWMLAEFAAGQAVAFQSKGNKQAVQENWRFFRTMAGPISSQLWLVKQRLNRHVWDRLIRCFLPRSLPQP